MRLQRTYWIQKKSGISWGVCQATMHLALRVRLALQQQRLACSLTNARLVPHLVPHLVRHLLPRPVRHLVPHLTLHLALLLSPPMALYPAPKVAHLALLLVAHLYPHWPWQTWRRPRRTPPRHWQDCASALAHRFRCLPSRPSSPP